MSAAGRILVCAQGAASGQPVLQPLYSDVCDSGGRAVLCDGRQKRAGTGGAPEIRFGVGGDTGGADGVVHLKLFRGQHVFVF